MNVQGAIVVLSLVCMLYYCSVLGSQIGVVCHWCRVRTFSLVMGWNYGVGLVGMGGMGGRRGNVFVVRTWWRYMRTAREFRVGVDGRR